MRRRRVRLQVKLSPRLTRLIASRSTNTSCFEVNKAPSGAFSLRELLIGGFVYPLTANCNRPESGTYPAGWLLSEDKG